MATDKAIIRPSYKLPKEFQDVYDQLNKLATHTGYVPAGTSPVPVVYLSGGNQIVHTLPIPSWAMEDRIALYPGTDAKQGKWDMYAMGEICSLSSASNAYFGSIYATGGAVRIVSGKTGAQQYVPIQFYTSGVKVFELSVTGAATLTVTGTGSTTGLTVTTTTVSGYPIVGGQYTVTGVSGYDASALYTTASGGNTNRGGYFSAISASGTTAYGVYAVATGSGTNYAGYFSGNIYTSGTLSTGAGITQGAGYFTLNSYNVGTYGSGSIQIYYTPNTSSLHLGNKNLTDIGTINSQTISSAANFTGTITTADKIMVSQATPYIELRTNAATNSPAFLITNSGATLGRLWYAGGSGAFVTGSVQGDIGISNSTAGKSILFGSGSTKIATLDSSGDWSIAGYVKASNQTQVVWSYTSVAGTSPGNTLPTATTWTETSSSFVNKIETHYRHRAGNKYLRLSCNGYISAPLGTAYYRITANGSSASTTTASTSGNNWVTVQLDCSGFTDGTIYAIDIAIHSDGTYTASMRYPVIEVESV